MRAGLEGLARVPGRMELIDLGQPFRVLVDYAHTPEALAKALDSVAAVAAAGGGGLIAVFGSAGDRDTAKRPMMGRVAGERCRLVVVTDEDPRLGGPRRDPGCHRRGRGACRSAAWPRPAARPGPGDGHRRGHRPGAPG
ncbi:MAG: cyanophycin synthetase [Chloroflexota bacterium]